VARRLQRLRDHRQGPPLRTRPEDATTPS
jgi:hypothetical protein